MWRTAGTLLALWWMTSDVVGASAAPRANPSLTARDSGVDDASAAALSLDIGDLDVRVDIVGNVAHTMVAASFNNPRGGDLEGTFTLQMPDGAVVTGYALDVDGEMIDGVLAPPIRARRAYEERLRRGVDPGVAEVARGNVFSTRVYPILTGKGRTVRLTFATPIHAERGFTLPLALLEKATRVHLSVQVAGDIPTPTVTWPAGVKSEWHATDAGSVNEIELRGRKLAGALHVDLPQIDGRVFVTRHPSGKRFIELRDSVPEVKAPEPPRTARVYWDRSASRRDDRLADEIELLERYFAAVGLWRIEVVPFNSSGARAHAVQDAAAATRKLRELEYRGATSFGALAQAGSGKADVCLLFTDGIANLEARPELRLGCPLYIITSAPDADLGYLELLARRNAGAVLRLGADSVDTLVKRLRWPAPRVVDVRSGEGRELRFASVPTAARGWALIAEAPASGDVIVRVAGIAAGVTERRYEVDTHAERFTAAGALWAHDRVSQLVGDGRRAAELEELSRRYSIASPALSFVVLESPADYVASGIAPPRSYPKDLFEEYLEAKREHDADETESRKQWLEKLVDSWDDQKEWWEQEFDPDAHKGAAEKRKAIALAAQAQAQAQSRAAVAAPAPAAAGPNRSAASESMDSSRQSSAEMDEMAESVVVTGFRASAGGPPQIAIELEAWDPNRPYLRALDAAGASGFDRVYAEQEKEFGALPVFYFDVAEWLFRRQRVAEATEVLLSALELPSRDTETIELVADRIARYGQLDRAIWLYEEVCRLDPDRPQPARTLALALEQRALAPRARDARKDLERALTLLSDIAMTPPNNAYEGIELIALMDANGIIPRLRALGSHKVALDPRLVAVLDVDLRVVIEWNTAATDMDLWVDQPDGERSIYNNPQTDIGGRLSNDMTSGYGPEEYLLRRAIDGEYAISVNVYASDAINPNGATMVTAHLTRNFGRVNQSTETMELELKPDERGEKLIGRFNVMGRSSLSGKR